MLGIAGRRPVDPHALERAVTALAHRGPDGRGVHLDADAAVGLGHTRLAIIDPSDAGRQPMRSPDGRYAITFNGEIYNFQDLRRELEDTGAVFRSRSDTEVLLQGYIRYGAAVLAKLNGIFALAILDAGKQEVLVARDPMGVKPLYYAAGGYGVVFASEIRALFELAPVSAEIDRAATRRYVSFLWSPGEQTALAAVKKLEPGCAMVLRHGAIVRRWRYGAAPEYEPRTDWSAEQCADELRAHVHAAVRRQMVSDAPLGAFLSGGLDSSAVVAAASAELPDLCCFTVDPGDADAGEEADLPYARSVASRFGLPLETVPVRSAALAARFTDMVRILEEPLADPACLNVLAVAERARSSGIKVLLSGVGGDDVFSGYRRHTALLLEPVWSSTPRAARRFLAAHTHRVGASWPPARRLSRLLAPVAEDGDRRIAAAFGWGAPGTADQLLATPFRDVATEEELLAPLVAELAGRAGLPALEKCLRLEKRFFLGDHNLIYTDKMAMAAGVEVRTPLLDLELLAFAARIPAAWKQRGLTGKWIFRRSQAGVLPDAVLRRSKMGFGAPLRRWLRTDLRELADDLLSPRTLGGRGVFDPQAVRRLREADAAGRVDGAYMLFAVMCFELWCREFVDARSAPATQPHGVAVCA